MNVKQMIEENENVDTVEDLSEGRFRATLHAGFQVLVEHQPGKSVDFYTAFQQMPITAEQATDWNKNHRFAVVYPDSDGDFALEATCPLWGDPELSTVVGEGLNVFLSALKAAGAKFLANQLSA